MSWSGTKTNILAATIAMTFVISRVFGYDFLDVLSQLLGLVIMGIYAVFFVAAFVKTINGEIDHLTGCFGGCGMFMSLFIASLLQSLWVFSITGTIIIVLFYAIAAIGLYLLAAWLRAVTLSKFFWWLWQGIKKEFSNSVLLTSLEWIAILLAVFGFPFGIVMYSIDQFRVSMQAAFLPATFLSLCFFWMIPFSIRYTPYCIVEKYRIKK